MNATIELRKFVKDIMIEESLSALLKQKIKAEKKDKFIPKNYFYITHVTNPAKFFWEQKKINIEKTPDIARKLLLGTKLGRIAALWFRKLPSFFVEEGKLDGVWVDIPGVRGSIDFRIGDSIIEFKTKDSLPETGSEVIDKYPQDLEQLAFYAIIHPDFPKENYLVFMNSVPPYEVRAFKVAIIDGGRLKTLLLSRIKILREAIEKDDPSQLGQCRYFETGCEYHICEACDCAKKEPLSTDILKKSIDLSYDDKFTKQLSEVMKESLIDNYFSTKDIISPRKHYMDQIGKDDGWAPDKIREEYIACFGNIIRKMGLNIHNHEQDYIKGLLKEPRLYIANRWLRLKSSSKPDGEVVPYLVKISHVKDMKFTTNPGDYAIAELAIVCAAYGKAKGLIFTIFPELDDYVQVHSVTYQSISEILKFVTSTINSLEKACKEKNIYLLHPCPEWMNKDENCPMTKECHKENVKGCIKK